MRTILEVESARLAVERASERDRAELAEALRRVCDVTQQPEEYVEVATREHTAIVEWVLAGDGEGARAAMRAHLSRVAEEINVVLNRDCRVRGRV